MEPRRRVVAGLTVAAVALIVAGVAAVAIDSGFYGGGTPTASRGQTGSQSSTYSIATPTPTASGSTTSGPITSGPPGETPAVATPPPSPIPSPTAHPPGFAMRGDTLVYYASDGTVVPVQPVAGLRTALVEGRVLYYALASNRYNLKTGSYAGEFDPNVTMQQADGSSAQTGGIVLVGPAANRLIADNLASISAPSQRWIVALPVDIRNATKTVDIAFDQYGLHGWSDTPRVVVRFAGQLPVVNVIPNNAGYHVLVEQLGVTAWQVIDPTRLGLSATKLDPDHPMNELLVYGSGTPGVRKSVLVDRRVAVGQPMLTASDEVSVSLVVRGSRADLGPDRVLQVGDVPVFVASS
jgi:hypothetical protein